jgi:hypothetical protein
VVTVADLLTQFAKLRRVTSLAIISSTDHNDLVDLADLLIEYLKDYVPTGGGDGGVPLSGIVHYPFAGDFVLDTDPTYSYGEEFNVTENSYTEKMFFEVDKPCKLLSAFINLFWAMVADAASEITAKWQIASGTHASSGTFCTITDEHNETATAYSDHSRSGVVSHIAGFPVSCPFVIRLVAKRQSGSGGKVKVKSNTYVRLAVAST